MHATTRRDLNEIFDPEARVSNAKSRLTRRPKSQEQTLQHWNDQKNQSEQQMQREGKVDLSRSRLASPTLDSPRMENIRDMAYHNDQYVTSLGATDAEQSPSHQLHLAPTHLEIRPKPLVPRFACTDTLP